MPNISNPKKVAPRKEYPEERNQISFPKSSNDSLSLSYVQKEQTNQPIPQSKEVIVKNQTK